MKKQYYKEIDETLYETKLDNGLQLFIIPKAGFQKTYVTMTTKYGSLHTDFIPAEGNDMINTPAGVAHFLEHKMFEKEAGDMFNVFSEQGASVNAFTSYDRTSYLFTAVDHVEENIKLLIEMVQKPYFSETSVQKEIGIIAEEIKMYQEQPNYRLYYQTLQAMYQNHPVRQDIAGTLNSINEITAETLYTCYHTFYRPENMVMFVVGNVEPAAIAEFISEKQMIKNQPVYQPVTDDIREPKEVKERFVSTPTDITRPKLMLGIKSDCHLQNRPLIQTEFEMMFILELLLGEQSDFYHELLADGLIDDSFGYSFILEPTFSHMLIAGATPDPEILKQRIIERFETAEFDESAFRRLVKQTTGEYIASFNSLEYIANQFTRYYFNGAILFDIVQVLQQINLRDALTTFHQAVDMTNMTDSRLVPRG
ncbi:insulinase family protein [Macrococcus brunensis]|uniref:Insulinase family protein n=1 Tax=Macrococcus brunensis TaxID=198483 RepID=A0A4R6BDI1_9STAP|nr:pitrilysin family protein [Macrococcus brunensis]TDL97785.1 insulinase family protein [Macrococcus brunensis]ULG72936.1 insulinase family protein [Macrococcus brunensis]ULG75184.1 insulinase family protein [Macrococcus brunensis]